MATWPGCAEPPQKAGPEDRSLLHEVQLTGRLPCYICSPPKPRLRALAPRLGASHLQAERRSMMHSPEGWCWNDAPKAERVLNHCWNWPIGRQMWQLAETIAPKLDHNRELDLPSVAVQDLHDDCLMGWAGLCLPANAGALIGEPQRASCCELHAYADLPTATFPASDKAAAELGSQACVHMKVKDEPGLPQAHRLCQGHPGRQAICGFR